MARKPSICLFMIVKNEQEHMPRLISNVAPLIDRVVICDTGSQDRTLELTHQALEEQGIPGQVLQHEWRNFGHNRTLAIRAARGQADYLLTLDADCELLFEEDAQRIRGQLAAGLDEYTATLEHGSLGYRRTLFFRDDPAIDWHCVGVVHEYFSAGTYPARRGHVSGLRVRTVGAAGGLRSGRYERDLELLKDELRKNPADTRSQFYLAQTLRDLRRPAEAAAEYRKRAAMGGWVEEVYYSLYQAAALEGDCYDMLRAFSYRPGRAEAAYACARQFREQQRFEFALAVCRQYASSKSGAAEDLLFLEKDPALWGMELEHALAEYYSGDVSAFTRRSLALLATPGLPEHVRALVEDNIAKYGERPRSGQDVA